MHTKTQIELGPIGTIATVPLGLIGTISYRCAMHTGPESYFLHMIIFSAILYKMLERIFGPNSITYCNGEEGRERHKSYGRCFKDQALSTYYDTFRKVCLTQVWNIFI